MKRNGLVLAGGIIAIARGAIGTLTGFSSTSTIATVEQFVPGYGQIFAFEMLLSLAVLTAGIYAVVKANDPQAGGAIRGWGIAILVGAAIDFFWGMSLFSASPEVIASALGSVASLGLIAGLLIAGGRRLEAQTS